MPGAPTYGWHGSPTGISMNMTTSSPLAKTLCPQTGFPNSCSYRSLCWRASATQLSTATAYKLSPLLRRAFSALTPNNFSGFLSPHLSLPCSHTIYV